MSLSIRNQKCWNEECAMHGLVLAGNVVVHSSREGRFRCNECGKTWVKRKGKKSFRLRVEVVKLERVGALIQEGVSLRKTAEFVGVSFSTVKRWKKNSLINI